MLRAQAGFPRESRPFRLSPFGRFVLMRLTLIPAQMLFVLVILYAAIQEPTNIATNQNLGVLGFFHGFAQMVANDFTGNWGISTFDQYPSVPISQLYGYLLPSSVELGVFSLGISAAIAYPVALWIGWSRRPGVDVAARVASLFGTLLPVFIVGLLVITALFFWFLAQFNDLPDGGVIPGLNWWLVNYQGYPSWILYQSITRPTGFPLVDGVINQAWTFEEITLIKTLIQAVIIALVYVTIFLRHARSVVRAASEETHLVAARMRGVPEGTLLWKHTARRVTPTFLIVFALTLPAYLGTQFVVEATFLDPGMGFLALSALTNQGSGSIAALQAMMFLLSLIVIFWLFAVDLLARRMDPREVASG
ncbi:MAG: ABC transporter permease subunit [Thermoplasmata archaeon]